MTHALRFWIRLPHLSAAGIALVAATIGAWLLSDVLQIEKRLTHLAAPEMLDVKDQGLSLQGEAFRDKDLLPIYGSSEFRNDTAYSGRTFFSNYPTGFGLFIVGKAGSKSLITTQRIGALGREVRGKKVVIVLSPTWFLSPKESAASYRGNFSALQASKLIFDSPLSRSLKRDIAREMLKYPETLAGHPLLSFELKRLVSKKRDLADRLVMSLGKSEDFFQGLLDRAETPFALSEEIARNSQRLVLPTHHPTARPDWNMLAGKAARVSSPKLWEEEADTAAPKLAQKLRGKFDTSFTALMDHSDEWIHLELLMRTFQELGVKPLFISIPINADAFEMAGVKPFELDYYYARLRDEIGDFHYPLATFEAEQNNPYFFADSLGHPSSTGWMIFNHTINEFYHGKLPPPGN